MQHAHWIAQAKAHWKEHQPTRFKELQRTGLLLQALTDAANQTQQELETLMMQGFKYSEAWEMLREDYLFPPEEAGASEEAPNSQGYQAMRQYHKEMGQLTLPGERAD